MNIEDKIELVSMYYESSTSYKEAIEKVKAQYPNTTKDKELEKNINEIIPLDCDIDNGEVYRVSDGKTINDLI